MAMAKIADRVSAFMESPLIYEGMPATGLF
jgi:hypothetical protein